MMPSTRPETIRPATMADAPAVRQCARRAYAPYVPVIGREPAPMVADFDAAIRAGRLWVSVDGGGAVNGYIVFYPDGPVMHLENVAVLHPGRGIGGRLIAFCERAAARAGLAAVDLYTNAAMTANLSLYPSLGYRETGRRVEDGFDRVFFRKDLAPPAPEPGA